MPPREHTRIVIGIDRPSPSMHTRDVSPRDVIDRINEAPDLVTLTGPDAPALPPVRVEEWEGRRVVIIGDVDGPIWSRWAVLDGLARQVAGDVLDPLLSPVPPAALAAFDVPTPVKKNRAQDRAAGQRGKRTK